jgi:hypothetical protein
MQRSRAILITVACVSLGTACDTLDLRTPGQGTDRAGLCLSLGTGCNPVTLVPGADQVRLTQSPDDVANCRPSGNIDLSQVVDARKVSVFRNQVVGLGGNAAVVTEGSLREPIRGVVYQCP